MTKLLQCICLLLQVGVLELLVVISNESKKIVLKRIKKELAQFKSKKNVQKVKTMVV